MAEGPRKDPIRESQNFMWSLNSIIRREKNGNVYKGYGKLQGQHYPHSVKVLDKITPAGINEFELLKLVNHENVVKLFATEKDLISQEVVLVMEYCNGSNLFSILLKPENAYGLKENDFISLLHDLACGMKHLRDKNIVHRNINPKNIIQHETEDGRCIFKLFDFGTARLLDEEDTFQSSYGEIEYQFPAMYENSGTGLDVPKQFEGTVDLWSIGVTLYQAAACHLPFQPYGGARSNPIAMFEMTSKKDSGCISCSQNRPNGPLNYSRSLPDTCNLSIGLQNLLVPLLAALLESDREKIMTFDRFFQEVEKIVSSLVTYVFNVSECKLLHVYCSRDLCALEFFDLIRQQVKADVSVESKTLYFQDRLIFGWIAENQVMSSLPVTSSLDPIFLLPSFTLADDKEKIEFSKKSYKFLPMKEGFDAINDLSVAKFTCKELCHLRQSAADLSVKQRLMLQTTKKLNFILQQNISELHDSFQGFGSLLFTDLENRIQLLLVFNEIFGQIFPDNLESLTRFKNKLEHYRKIVLKVIDEFELLQSKIKRLQLTVNEKAVTDSLNHPLLLRCHRDIGHDCEKSIESRFAISNEIKVEFEKKTQWKAIDKEAECHHKCQKERLRKYFTESLNIVQETCFQNLQNIFEHATQAFNTYQDRNETIESLTRDGKWLLEKSRILANNIDEIMDELIFKWKELCKKSEVADLSLSQLLELEDFRDVSFHKIINNEFAFPVSPEVYRELKEAGVLQSSQMLQSPVVKDHGSLKSNESVPSKSPTSGMDETSKPFVLCEGHLGQAATLPD